MTTPMSNTKFNALLKLEVDGILSSPISALEMKKKKIESSPNSKAPGIDGICYKHIKFSSETATADNVISQSASLFPAMGRTNQTARFYQHV